MRECALQVVWNRPMNWDGKVAVVSDGGTGFNKALKKIWGNAKHQRCLFHVFSQVKRYTTSRPNTMAGIELYQIARDLLKIKEQKETKVWVDRFLAWAEKYRDFLNEMTRDEKGNERPTHARLLKAAKSLIKLIKRMPYSLILIKTYAQISKLLQRITV